MSSITRAGPRGLRVATLGRRLFERGITLGIDFYYRFCYGRPLPFAVRLAALVQACERGRRGDVPVGRLEWETQYDRGQWDMLAHRRELGRYSILAGYASFLYEQPRVLDIGCGDGLLALRLRGHYREYIGVDIAQAAIARARTHIADAHTHFVHADAETYAPGGSYDFIVFNESLYYFVDPHATFLRYARALAPGGAIALSMYRGSPRARAIARQLAARYPLLDCTSVRNGSLVWECSLFKGSPDIFAVGNI